MRAEPGGKGGSCLFSKYLKRVPNLYQKFPLPYTAFSIPKTVLHASSSATTLATQKFRFMVLRYTRVPEHSSTQVK